MDELFTQTYAYDHAMNHIIKSSCRRVINCFLSFIHYTEPEHGYFIKLTPNR